MAQPRGPLDGLKVVSCSTAQAGTVPYMLMADLGAEVVKIEVPGVGDSSRTQGKVPGYPSTCRHPMRESSAQASAARSESLAARARPR